MEVPKLTGNKTKKKTQQSLTASETSFLFKSFVSIDKMYL